MKVNKRPKAALPVFLGAAVLVLLLAGCMPGRQTAERQYHLVLTSPSDVPEIRRDDKIQL